MKFLIINGKLARMSNGDFITVPDNYNNEPLVINGKLLTVGGAIVGKNFTGEAQLATPQNVTADGTNVSWDAVENATSYAVLADGSEIGTVENQTGYNVSVQNVSQHSMATPFNVGFGYDNGTNIQYDGFPSFISSGSYNAVVSLNTKDYANSNGLAPNIIVVGVHQAIIAVVENVNTTGGATFVRYGEPSEYPYSDFAYNTIAIYKI